MSSKVFFEWDEQKDLVNQRKHGVSFRLARKAFEDPNRVIIRDIAHSQEENDIFV